MHMVKTMETSKKNEDNDVQPEVSMEQKIYSRASHINITAFLVPKFNANLVLQLR